MIVKEEKSVTLTSLRDNILETLARLDYYPTENQLFQMHSSIRKNLFRQVINSLLESRDIIIDDGVIVLTQVRSDSFKKIVTKAKSIHHSTD